jgi:RNA-binding protein
MPSVTPAQRRALRARAHHLHPVVSVGQHGLTPAVLHEIDVNLRAHELIKVRVFSDARAERDTLFERICAELDAAPVQHIGKLLVMWRPAPDEPKKKAAARTSAPGRNARGDAGGEAVGSAGARSKAQAMAKRAPQARRPRNPIAKTPARLPVPAGPRRPRSGPVAPTPGRRRRRGVS